MKTKLVQEAIDAFKAKKGELPADAGYPVVREKDGDVYFSHSVEDWEKFAKEQKLYSSMFRVVLFGIAIAVATIIIGVLFHVDIWVVLSVCIFSQVIPMAYLALALKEIRRKVTDIFVYVGEREKIYAIL